MSALFSSSAASTAGSAAASTAATTAGTSAAAAGGAAASSGGLFSGLSSVTAAQWLGYGATAISALTSIGAGNAQSAALKEQQVQADFQSRQALLQGRRESLESLIALNETMARNQVAGATSGLVTSEGSVKAAQEGASRKADFETSMSRDNAEIIAASKRSQAYQYGLEAKSATTSGYGKAAGILAQAAFTNARRG